MQDEEEVDGDGDDEDDDDDEEEEMEDADEEEEEEQSRPGILLQGSSSTSPDDSETEEVGRRCRRDRISRDVDRIDSALEQQQHKRHGDTDMCSNALSKNQPKVHIKIEDDEDVDDDEDDEAVPQSNVVATSSVAVNTVVGTSSSCSSSAVIELKRARVENIISSMRSSPSRGPQPNEVPQVNGCKKRKLYMPQQHEGVRIANVLMEPDDDDDDMDAMMLEEASSGGPPPCKQQRKGEQNLLKRQLTQMQAQIAAIQHKLDLCDGRSSDSDDGRQRTTMACPAVTAAAASSTADTASPLLFHLGFVSGKNRPDRNVIRGGELEPAHFIDEARRLVHEQERLTKEAENKMTSSAAAAMTMTTTRPAEPKVAATAAAAAAAVVPKPAVVPPDWETLADILKLGMSSLIDDWVRRCAVPTSKPFLFSGADGSMTPPRIMKEHGSSPAVVANPPTSGLTLTASSPSTSITVTSSSISQHLQQQQQQQHMMPGDRRSPRTKVIDRGRMGAAAMQPSGPQMQHQHQSLLPPSFPTPIVPLPPPPPPPPPPPHSMAALFGSSNHFAEMHMKPSSAMFSLPTKSGGGQQSLPSGMYAIGHHHVPSIFPYGSPHVNGGGGAVVGVGVGPGLGGESPEQSEALPLVVAPKKKRHKVTDTRITPRTVSRILGHHTDSLGGDGPPKFTSLLGGRASSPADSVGFHHHGHHHSHHSHHHQPPIVPVSLPTSVAIPNPSLHQSDVFSPYPYYGHHGHGHGGGVGHHPRDRCGSPHSESAAMMDEAVLLQHHHQQVAAALHSSLLMSSAAVGAHGSSPDPMQLTSSQLKAENGGDSSDCNSGDLIYDGSLPTSSTLTPMHLRKAKLMFFYVRYPSSAILKTYFPDIKFNKNNTAQLVKWFSNFREFFYIQMEKYARQALSEGCKGAEELMVTTDSELYRVLNLHYNRNNHIEVPTDFRYVVEQTLREFFKSIAAAKDTEQSWKKAIYKVIARLDNNLPDYFKSPNFLEQLE